MNYSNSHEIQGRYLSEYTQISVSGLTEYVVGSAANATLSGSWPQEGSLPAEAQRFKFYASDDTYVQFIPLWLTVRQSYPSTNPDFIPPGLPVAQLIPKNTTIIFDVRAWMIFLNSKGTPTVDVWIEG